MPDGLILSCAGLVCLLMFAVILAREPSSQPPALHDWLLLILGVLCTGTGAVLLWVALFSR